MPRSLQAQLASNGHASRAWYDPLARRLLLRRAPTAQRAWVVNELVRALVDQNFNLRRIAKLRVHDRDRAIAAKSIVDGTAALASGVSASPVRGTPLERFVELESGLGAGKALAKELRYLGGSRALASALRLFPQTTEQLLHIDKFLQRERALPVRLPTRIGDWRLSCIRNFRRARRPQPAAGVRRAQCSRRCRRLGRRAHRALRLADRTDDRRARPAVGHRRGFGRVAGCRDALRRSGVPRRNRTRLPAARRLLVEHVGRCRRRAGKRRASSRADRLPTRSLPRCSPRSNPRVEPQGCVRSPPGVDSLEPPAWLQFPAGKEFSSFQYPRGGILTESRPGNLRNHS